MTDALVVDGRLLAFLAVAAAVGAIPDPTARLSGAVLAGLGVALEIAARVRAEDWATVLLSGPQGARYECGCRARLLPRGPGAASGPREQPVRGSPGRARGG
jgi:hypothetical protein